MNLPSFDLLKALVATADAESLAEAAKRLNISQPALSMQLKKLESQVGCAIFAFRGNRKILTPYGRALVRVARKELVRLAGNIEALNRRFSDPARASIRIGCRRERIPKVASLLQFKGRISFVHTPSQDVVSAVLNHQVDAGICSTLPEHPELIGRKLFSTCSWLLVHRKWLKGRTADEALISHKDFLTGTPALAYGADAPLLSEWAGRQGLSLRDLDIRYTCEDWMILTQFVEAGMGYCITPDDIESHSPDVCAVWLPCELAAPITHYLVMHRSLRKFPAYRSLFK